MSVLDSELVRYIEHLQQQLLDQDFAEFFDREALVNRMKSNPEPLQRLLDRYSETTTVADFIAAKENFDPPFKHDSYDSHYIFSHLLANIQRVSDRLNISPRNPVIIASSTSIGLSPIARPSSAEHIIFAGSGTMAFCNYWAKAYAKLLFGFGSLAMPETLDQCDLPTLVKQYPEPVLLMSRLFLHYASFGTLIGFGEVPMDPRHDGIRLELLEAMETFAIAHEIGHLVLEERQPTRHSTPDASVAHAIEFFCDRYGATVSRFYGSDSNWSCFTSTGAILYLHAGSMCLALRRRLEDGTSISAVSESHPDKWDRIGKIVNETILRTEEDQRQTVERYLLEILAVTKFVEKEVYPLVCEAIDNLENPSPSSSP